MTVRRARPDDATAIGSVHVAVWRSAYAGILPEAYLARLSSIPHAWQYNADIRAGHGVFVATGGGTVIGFATATRVRAPNIAEGEVHTLYVLDDWRDRGIGRKLLQACAEHLRDKGCRSAFLWVLEANGSRWFYQRLGGKPSMHSKTSVGGVTIPKTAYVWDPIEAMLPAALP